MQYIPIMEPLDRLVRSNLHLHTLGIVSTACPVTEPWRVSGPMPQTWNWNSALPLQRYSRKYISIILQSLSQSEKGRCIAYISKYKIIARLVMFIRLTFVVGSAPTCCRKSVGFVWECSVDESDTGMARFTIQSTNPSVETIWKKIQTYLYFPIF